jgi:P-type conjugative transfer protein TrbJ
LTRKRRLPIVLGLLLTTLLATASPASATIPVYDYINWILSFYQRYEQIANQARQISNQVQQIRHLAKGLESFAGADWSHFDFNDLDALLAYGEHLGYLNRSLSDVFDDTFPGYERPESWPAEFETRVRRTRETLRLVNQSLRSLSDADSQIDFLALLQRRSETADSPLEELETSNMYANYSLVHLQRAIQANLLTANTIAIAQAEELQTKASAEAARNGWIDRDPLPPIRDDDGSGHTGVPDGWSYSIF